MPLVQTRGAASAQGFGEFARATAVNYIEEVFSTYLYDGTGAVLTITNNIDLSTKGGLVWIKRRNSAASHKLTDTVRGATKALSSNDTNAQTTDTTGLTAFSSTGFTLGSDANYNDNSTTNVAWTFREQAKFFDIVTYTGTGANSTIAHSLGSVPGCMIVRRDTSANWAVYHRSLANTDYLYLNSTAAAATDATLWNSTTPTSSVFSVGTSGSVNASGGTYTAYLFAHDSAGFGLTGLDNVISCSLFTTDGTGKVTVNLGYEPQFIFYKRSDAVGDWIILDTMRGLTLSTDQYLRPNLSNAESAASNFEVNSTGFYWAGGNTNANYIYIAIRRGPMKVPTSGTSVFAPITATASTGTSRTVGFPADMTIGTGRNTTSTGNVNDRLRGYENSNSGTAKTIYTVDTYAEGNSTPIVYNVWNTTALDGGYWNSWSTIWWHFRRAPSFFDEVCYTGNDTAGRTVTHNLGAVPELIIVKTRSAADSWYVYSAAIGNTKYLRLNATSAEDTYGLWNNTSPTASVFSLGGSNEVNASTRTYVAYLFATCAGVSKVGSYTGTGTTLQVNCGFTGGARFVLIKRTNSTGDWYVWDSARGIVSGNDPYLLLNSTAAEVTSTDYIDTYSAGFEISSTAPAAINASGGTFIFLAIA